MTIDQLIKQRDGLQMDWDAVYDADAFPGSRRWLASEPARKALADFDVAHPEVLAEIKRRSAAAREARLAGKDIMGL